MVEINLLPEELRKKEPRFKKIDLSGLNLQNLPVVHIAAYAIGALVAFHLILFSIGSYSKAVMGSLQKRYDELLPRKKEAEALSKQVDTMSKKVNAIDALMVKRFSWAKKLNALSDSVTPGIWLSELSYNEKVTEHPVPTPAGKNKSAGTVMEKSVSKYLIISGYVSSMGEQGTALVGKFIKSLKDNSNFYSDFSSIELGAIRSDKIEGQEVMNFKLTCLFARSE